MTSISGTACARSISSPSVIGPTDVGTFRT
jgi:hypothetical protein